MFAVMVVYSAVLMVFGGRIETVGVLRGQPADERLASHGVVATVVAGTVATLVVLAGLLWQIAHGQSGSE